MSVDIRRISVAIRELGDGGVWRIPEAGEEPVPVASFGHALQRDHADKSVRVQTVLPAAMATGFWDVAGYAKQRKRRAR